MTPEEKAKALDVLLEGSFSFQLDMNDTFAFACGDSEEMWTSDFPLMAPIIAKYGHDALRAYAAVKRAAEPIVCGCNYRNERYYAARREIEAIQERNPDFMKG